MEIRATGAEVAAALAVPLNRPSAPKVMCVSQYASSTSDIPRLRIVGSTWSPANGGTMFITFENGQRFRLIVIEEEDVK